MMRGMVIDMNDRQLLTLAQLRSFLNGTVALDFAAAPDERYAFIARTVRRFSYARLKRADKSVVLCFLACVSSVRNTGAFSCALPMNSTPSSPRNAFK